MRFIENGPSLPAHLLEEQAQGNVIFFCGAGVSIPAGLDSFWALTNRIIDTLDASKARKALADNVSFDRVFNALVHEFGRDEINSQIYAALGGSRPRKLKHHSDILALSRGASGNTQIVTTNFDRLFEYAGQNVRPIVPPALPDIELNQPIRGIVYLHGRLSQDLPNYVIGSSDFGRAYLAEGWATRFVKALRERYTIVLLGYSADDPPMRYLLEGLNVCADVIYHSPIYVFTDRSPDEAEEIWQDRGVTPICYIPDRTHSALWRTIACWANAARSPDQWRDEIMALARQSPANLKPFQRGQVVQLISTTKGAKAFADADPAPSAEWLSVFDPNFRYLPPGRASRDHDAKEIDPQDYYGLDDDPLRPSPVEGRPVPAKARNPLAWQKGDGVQPERITLQSGSALSQFPLPDRLHHLARWFATQSHQPAALWWASAGHRLNPHLLWFVSIRVRGQYGKAMPPDAQTLWSLYLERLDMLPREEGSSRWLEFEGMLNRAGWTPAVARFFERCVAPFVELSRPFMSPPRPPLEDWDKLRPCDVVDLKVVSIDRHNHEVKWPPEALAQVARIVRGSLERTSALLDEIGHVFWHPPTLFPEADNNQFAGKKSGNILWFRTIYLALAAYDPDLARREFLAWPTTEMRIFPKFRLWAAADPSIVTAAEALAIIVSLPRETIWNAHNQRELLHLMKARWGEWSYRQKRTVERLLEAGPPAYPDEKRRQYRERRSAYAASNLRWFELQRCELTVAGQHALAKLKLIHPKWNDSWAKDADDSHDGRVGWVQEVSDPGDLDLLPLSEVVVTALARTKRPMRELASYHPFRGLVQEHPYKALAALRAIYRKGEFPQELWRDLFSEWPESTAPRLQCLLGRSFIQLDPVQAITLRFEAPRWLKKQLPTLYADNRANALAIFDGFLQQFLSSPPAATDSGIGTRTIAGVEQQQSELSFTKAINSPIGALTQALWELTPKKAKRHGLLNCNLASRFERLADAPGHGGGHAIAVLTQNMGWIDYCFRDWAEAFLLPMFQLDHPLAEAAWHGLAFNGNSMSAPFWQQLKVPMLKILKGEADWRLDTQERGDFGSLLVWLSRPIPKVAPILSFEEIRNVLTAIDDDLRGRILYTLGNSLQKYGQWGEFIKPFIKNSWPRALRYRSDETTRGFVQIAEQAGDYFPDAVKTILPLIRPVPNADVLTYSISTDLEGKESIARSHPQAAIRLLNAITPDDRARMPYELAGTLDVLAEIDPRIKDMPEYRRLKDLLE